MWGIKVFIKYTQIISFSTRKLINRMYQKKEN